MPTEVELPDYESEEVELPDLGEELSLYFYQPGWTAACSVHSDKKGFRIITFRRFLPPKS
jgi:peroxiredoxin